MMESGNDQTPWKKPLPDQEAICSTGILSKKVRHDERLSLPLNTSPSTPTKTSRSKFVLPTTLTPFPFSPFNYSTHKTATGSLTSEKTLSDSVFLSDMAGYRKLEDNSSSPLTSRLKESTIENDIFALEPELADDDSDYDAVEVLTSEHCPIICPWRCPSHFLLDEDYFVSRYPSLNCLHIDHFATYPEYIDEEFSIVGLIGKGSFSSVFQIVSKHSGRIFALKKNNEPFHGVHDSLKDTLDFVGQNSIHFEESRIINIIHQIAKGLESIHSRGLVHLDLKPANILISEDGSLKITDFGLSRSYHEDLAIDLEGDKYYMAPEVLDGIITPAADIFSLGLIALELSSDIELPAFGESWHEIRSGSISLSELLPSSLLGIVEAMLCPSPSNRPSARDLVEFCRERERNSLLY